MPRTDRRARPLLLGLLLLTVIVIAAACSSDDDDGATDAVAAQEAPSTSTGGGDPPETTDSATSDTEVDLGEDAPSGVVADVTGPWATDWSNRTINLDELAVGIRAVDPRDRIPPIDEPQFESLDAAAEWLTDPSPGALVELDGIRRFYPLAILTQHEIVNDDFGDVPVAVTYCPLCNTAISFDRRVDGQVLRFGVSGLLRQSDLVMWDDATTSLWQQATGEGIVGDFAGTQLEFISTAITSYGDVVDSFPDTEVLSRDTGFPNRTYGTNPYVSYSSNSAPFSGFFQGEVDDRVPALERVVGITLDEGELGVPFSAITEKGALNTTIGDTPVAVLWASGAADALDHPTIDIAQDIGTGVAFSPVLDGQLLTFEANGDGTFTDAETGSTWDVLGNALDGELAGERLEPVTHRNDFWFAWSTFFPEAELYES
ncbi:MAG: DUF3179 domain-containing protein [Actinomycetota bacterium]